MEFGVLMILFSVSTYAMLAKILSNSIVTAPIAFLGVGYSMYHMGYITGVDSEEVLHLIAEIALIVVLFLDASQINLRRLKKQNAWPLRMLLLGLPLCILLGTLVGFLFFPEWPWVLVALVAAILAPTDAALGEAVISNKAVPKNERQSLTVESGLNDGLALPAILFFASLVVMKTSSDGNELTWLWYGLSQVFIGIFVGIAMGYGSAKMFIFGESKKLTSNVYEGIGVLALTGTSYLVATVLGGNGFISAFICGLAFGNLVKGHCRFIYQFTETEGQMLVWAAFTVIGLGLLPSAIEHLDWRTAGYIFASLFIVRPLAIYLSLLGTRSKPITRLFMGWFGPRGLATALFALMVSKELVGEYSHAVLVVAINAVWISTLLHGMSAAPAAKWYGARMQKTKQTKRLEQKKNSSQQ